MRTVEAVPAYVGRFLLFLGVLVTFAACVAEDDWIEETGAPILAKIDPLLQPYVLGDLRGALRSGDGAGLVGHSVFFPSPAPEPVDLEDDLPVTLRVKIVGSSGSALRSRVERVGGTVTTRTSRAVVADIPTAAIAGLSRSPVVDYIEAPSGASILLDVSVPDTRADDVHAGTGLPGALLGDGVIIGIVDSGIEWQHADFRNADGTTRILRLWDQELTPIAGETSPAGFPYGVEYTEADLNDELDGTPTAFVRSTDIVGHGTHVAGIAAGNGLATGNFTGMAPNADLVIVDGTNSGSFTDTDVLDGVNYILQVAAALGRPAVVNLSLGGQSGPHDGTTAYEATLNGLTGDGKIIIASAGNDGDNAIHTFATVATGAIVPVPFTVVAQSMPTFNAARLEFWYEGTDTIDASVISPSGATFGPFPQGTVPNCTTGVGCIDSAEGQIWVSHQLNPLNGDWQLIVRLRGTASGATNDVPSGGWSVQLTGVATVAERVDGWSVLGEGAAAFDMPTFDRTIGRPATAAEIISVAAYTTKTTWPSVDGSTYLIGGTLWEIAAFSSLGPSRDVAVTGQKPELAAPGNVVVSALSTAAGLPAFLIVDEGPGVMSHRVDAGTSMAAPHVTGGVALLLQVDPNLDPDGVEAVLTSTTCSDAGECGDGILGTAIAGLPNDTWGFGKLDALAAAASAQASAVGAFPTGDPTDGRFIDVSGQGISTIDVPNVSLFIGVPAGATTFTVEIFDGDQSGAFDVAPAAPTITCFRLTSDPLKDGTGAVIQAEELDSFFVDNAYTTLFSGPVDPSALAPSGNYFYRLDVVAGPDCDTPDPIPTYINAFKVRGTGQVSILFGEFSFIAADLAGPFTSPDPFLADSTDLNFTGTFDFFVSLPTIAVPVDVLFRDADADYLLDASAPGVATGANDIIRYLVFDSAGTLVFENTDVSGNYDVLAGDLDIEDNLLPTGGVGGMWRWRWDSMFTENNIHIWPPEGSPVTFELFGAPVTPLKVSSARSVGFWRNHPDTVAPHLPILLGQATGGSPIGASVLVTDTTLAEDILKPPTGSVDAGTRASEHLLAQLLAAKLNVAAAATLGENLGTALLYGSETDVAAVIAAADAAVAVVIDPATLDAAEIAALREHALLLDAINNGEVTYLPAMGGPPTAPNPPLGTPTNPTRL